MATRHCFSSLPEYLWDLPQGPRQGGVSREGFDVASDAAGHPFPAGESDDRVMFTVDTLPIKRRDPLASFDRTGAATGGAPLTEIRALHIDDHVRRARSEPPQTIAVNGAQLIAMQTFGVIPCIDSSISGRRRCASPEFSPPTRTEVGRRAVRYGDIVDVPSRKRIIWSPCLSSPRLAALQMESIDIDQRYGRKRPASCQAPAKGILPMDSPDFSLECKYEPLKASPRRKSYDYFKKSLEAERYARLIGRPHAGTAKEIQGVRLALELQRQRECEEALPSHLKRELRSRLSVVSTTASDDGSATMITPRSPAQSERSRPPSTAGSRASRSKSPVPLSAASRSVFGHWKELEAAADEHGSAEDVENDEVPHRQQTNIPLGVRRIMASLMPNTDDISEELMEDLRSALSVSMRSLGSARGPTRSTRYACSPPRRPANRRNGFRS